jgi:hypothetical protein
MTRGKTVTLRDLVRIAARGLRKFRRRSCRQTILQHRMVGVQEFKINQWKDSRTRSLVHWYEGEARGRLFVWIKPAAAMAGSYSVVVLSVLESQRPSCLNTQSLAAANIR